MATEINAIWNFCEKPMICAKQNAMHAIKFTHSVVINQNSKQYVLGNSSKEITVYTTDKCCKRAVIQFSWSALFRPSLHLERCKCLEVALLSLQYSSARI